MRHVIPVLLFILVSHIPAPGQEPPRVNLIGSAGAVPTPSQPVVIQGKVLISNQGDCTFQMMVNSQPVSVAPGRTTIVTVPIGPVLTKIPNENRPRKWTHWQDAGGEYVMGMYAYSSKRYRLRWRPRNSPAGAYTAAYAPGSDYPRGLVWVQECIAYLSAEQVHVVPLPATQ